MPLIACCRHEYAAACVVKISPEVGYGSRCVVRPNRLSPVAPCSFYANVKDPPAF